MRPVADRDDRGLTLVELMVTMVLFAMVGLVVTGMYGATSRSVSTGAVRVENTRNATQVMETLTRSVRAATKIQRNGTTALSAFSDPTGTSMTVHAAVSTAPVRYDYSVDPSGRLVETAVQSSAADAPYYVFTGTPTTRYIGRGIANPVSQPLFRYLDLDGDVVDVSGGATAIDSVRAVEITVVVQTDSRGITPATTLTQTVYLHNGGLSVP